MMIKMIIMMKMRVVLVVAGLAGWPKPYDQVPCYPMMMMMIAYYKDVDDYDDQVWPTNIIVDVMMDIERIVKEIRCFVITCQSAGYY